MPSFPLTTRPVVFYVTIALAFLIAVGNIYQSTITLPATVNLQLEQQYALLPKNPSPNVIETNEYITPGDEQKGESDSNAVVRVEPLMADITTIQTTSHKGKEAFAKNGYSVLAKPQDSSSQHVVQKNEQLTLGDGTIKSESIAVVHIGPPKTGSTTIQAAINKDINAFSKDGYSVLAPFYELPWCLGFYKHENRCVGKTPKLVRIWLKQASTQHRNLLLSSEPLSDSKIKLDQLSQLLEHWNDVRIVLVYRRFYEWLLSFYNQTHKRKQAEWHLYPSLVQWLSVETIQKEHVTKYDITTITQRLGKYYSNFNVLNMHDTDDIVTDFYCQMVPNAHHACLAAKQRKEETGEAHRTVHTSTSLEYDRLARAAYQNGLVDGKLKMKQVIYLTRYRQEEFLNLTDHDFPQECASPEILEKVLNMSLEEEREHFPEFFASFKGEIALRSQFTAASSRFCNGDVDEILKDEGWREFFLSLKKSKIKRIKTKKLKMN